MNGDDFRDQDPVRTRPLKSVQKVRVLGSSILSRRIAADVRLTVPHLEETDRDIPAVVMVAQPAAEMPAARRLDKVVLLI